jgi:hypothetical protein
LEAFYEAVQAGFVKGLPRHVAEPSTSAFYIVTEAEFNKWSVKDFQGIFRKQHILVTEMSTSTLEFNEEGLSTLNRITNITDIQGMSFFLRCHGYFSHGSSI